MQKMSKKYYAFFTLPTLVAFLALIPDPIPAWNLPFFYGVHDRDRFTMGGIEQLYSRIHG